MTTFSFLGLLTVMENGIKLIVPKLCLSGSALKQESMITLQQQLLICQLQLIDTICNILFCLTNSKITIPCVLICHCILESDSLYPPCSTP